MSRQYSLAHLTVPEMPAPEMVALAARTGYGFVSLRFAPVAATGPNSWYAPMHQDPALLRETKAVMADTGVKLLDVEVIRLAPETVVEDYRPIAAVTAELGGRHLLTQVHDTDYGRAVANFAAVCDLAAEYGLTSDLEFLPWTSNKDLGTCASYVRAVDKPNAGIVIDTLHFDRSGSDPADIAKLPPKWFRLMQLCDAPAERPTTLEGLLFHAREARDFPGHGGLDLASVLLELPPEIAIGLEIPNAELSRRMTDDQRVGAALQATRALLQSIGMDESGRRKPSLRAV
jgi:sugar phosphate isomerase/epimerase